MAWLEGQQRQQGLQRVPVQEPVEQREFERLKREQVLKAPPDSKRRALAICPSGKSCDLYCRVVQAYLLCHANDESLLLNLV